MSKLTDSDGELNETRHWLDRATAYGYLSRERRDELEELCDRIGSKLGRMMQRSDDFSGR